MTGGLANTGNTCSINTMLQCLGHCPLFRKLILDQQISFKLIHNRSFSIFQELRLLFHQLWIDKQSLVPVRFLKAYYQSLGDLYQPGEQFDFSEMWMLMLNNLLEETHCPEWKSEFIKTVSYQDNILDYLQKHAQHAWKQLCKLNNSPITDLVHGIQVQQIKCKQCNHAYHNVEPFSCIYLELVSEKFSKCFENYYEKELLQDWTCDHCKHKEAEKIVRFWRLPKVLLIILKRFNHKSKIVKPMVIEPRFTIKTLDESTYRFELKAIANHYGSLNYGHYNAHCKSEDNTWTVYDDTDIQKEIDIENILQTNLNGYGLFFEMV